MSTLSPSLRAAFSIRKVRPAHLTFEIANHPFSFHARRSQHCHSPPPASDQPTTPTPHRIHILGTGNVGGFIAHHLRRVPSPPPVTLLFHRPSLLETWTSQAEMIEVIHQGISTFSSGFDIELLPPTTPPPPNHPPSPIENLIIALKAPTTLPALRPLLPRLTFASTLVVLQNGLTAVTDARTHLFPHLSPSQQPHCAPAILTHGINSTTPFTLTHAGLGTIALLAPSPSTPTYLQETLLRSPALNATLHSPSQHLQLQWEKLAVNAIVNPLTALSGLPNGSILAPALAPTVRALVAEICAVVRALPEAAGEMKRGFRPERIEALVRGVAAATAANVSSMLQDVRRGRGTEVRWLTGYIVRRAEELGVGCEENRRVMRAVLGVEGRGRG